VELRAQNGETGAEKLRLARHMYVPESLPCQVSALYTQDSDESELPDKCNTWNQQTFIIKSTITESVQKKSDQKYHILGK
jgi:hypothetical protein